MGNRPLFRLMGLLAAAGLMGTQKCDDNLGRTSSGPVSFRVSVGTNSVGADDASHRPSISADGRFVCFASRANNLADPTSPYEEIFVRDRWMDTCENISRLAAVFDPNTQEDCDRPFLSASGQFVVFESVGELTFDISSGTPENFPGVSNIFFVDRANPGLQRVPPIELDADCFNPSVSDDGRYVAFQTAASNIPGFPNAAGTEQVYVFDRQGGIFNLISHSTAGPAVICDRDAQLPRVSANGQFVVFQSQATNLTADPNPSIGPDGPARRIYLAAVNGTGMELVSRGSGAGGTPADNHCTSPSLSGDGRYVAYCYQGGTMVPGAVAESVILRDRDPGSLASTLVATDVFIFGIFTTLGAADRTCVSDNGRYVSYTGVNAALTDLQISVRDMQGGTIAASKAVLTSVSSLSEFPGTFLSANGRWVVWTGDSDLEVLADSNAVPDVFGYGPIP